MKKVFNANKLFSALKKPKKVNNIKVFPKFYHFLFYEFSWIFLIFQNIKLSSKNIFFCSYNYIIYTHCEAHTHTVERNDATEIYFSVL